MSTPALLELFRAELDTHLPVLSDGLLAIEKGQAGEQDMAAMMRAAHSIKGAARIVGLDQAVRIAHAIEDCFTAARDGGIRIGSAAVDVLLSGVDTLQRICSPDTTADSNPIELNALVERIAALRLGKTQSMVESPREVKADLIPMTQPTRGAAALTEARIPVPPNLDAPAAARLRTALYEALARGAPCICLDFAGVKRVSADGMAVLVSFARDVGAKTPAPALAAEGAAGPVARLLRWTGMDRAWRGN